LYNYTGLHDLNNLGYTFINAISCIAKNEEFQKLEEIILDNSTDLWFLEHLDTLFSIPDTDTYSNPSDLVWMNWINEIENEYSFYSDDQKEFTLHTSVCKVIKNDLNEEKTYHIPSKQIRKITGITNYKPNLFLNHSNETIAFTNKTSEGSFSDNQEILIADKHIIQKALNDNDYVLFWFVEIYKEKNPLNKKLDKNFHVRKTRKYLVWIENGEYKHIKFWDEKFRNKRD